MRGYQARHAAPSNKRNSQFLTARRSGTLALASGAIALSSLIVLADPAHAATKVTLCHRTDSETNPYVLITVSASGAYHGHYREHDGDVWFSGHPKEPKWGDIIPPFTYGGQTYQLNWNTAGQAIFNGGCAVPSATRSTTAPARSRTTPPARTHRHTPPVRTTTPAAATSAAATTAAAATGGISSGTTSATSSAAGAPVVERSYLGEQIVAAPNGQRAAAAKAAALGGAAAAAGPIPGGANAGLAAVHSGSGDAPLWAEVALVGAAAAATAGVVGAKRRQRRSH